ncbi:hypothetical protein CMV_015047 [Castanea mollissima]|uniref:Uncharacterized protein n=1 Tax=Castanea mollissima TaxID=60419 RepID=A0A8J4RA56_9ROSI|nr:hypothetical protein CMV_015047 [Castanea mollissima]
MGGAGVILASSHNAIAIMQGRRTHKLWSGVIYELQFSAKSLFRNPYTQDGKKWSEWSILEPNIFLGASS